MERSEVNHGEVRGAASKVGQRVERPERLQERLGLTSGDLMSPWAARCGVDATPGSGWEATAIGFSLSSPDSRQAGSTAGSEDTAFSLHLTVG